MNILDQYMAVWQRYLLKFHTLILSIPFVRLYLVVSAFTNYRDFG